MGKQRHVRALFLLLATNALVYCPQSNAQSEGDSLSDADKAAIRAVSDAYVTGWLADDTLAILNTLDEEAVLMPTGLGPVIGIEEIKRFWWPDDGSRTIVTDYTMEVDEIEGNGSIAYTRGSAELSFTYEKGAEKTVQTNSTMYLTVYRRQPGGEWRILRRMWGPLRRY